MKLKSLLLLLISSTIICSQELPIKITAETFTLNKTLKYKPQKESTVRAAMRAAGCDFWVEKTNYCYFAEKETQEKTDPTYTYDQKATTKPNWRDIYKEIYNSLHAALKKNEEAAAKEKASK